jgi:anti-sigma factor RsiW
MSACQDYEELLTLHATAALEPAEEALVRAHLESCPACRSEAEATASLLGQVALPALSPAARQTLEAMPQRVTAAWRREQVRKALRTRAVGALMATAAVLMLMLAPSILRHDEPRALLEPSSTGAMASETEDAFEQWASADPLTEMIDPGVSLDDEESWEEEDAEELPESELFLNLNPGESL